MRFSFLLIPIVFLIAQCKSDVQKTSGVNQNINVDEAASLIKEGYTLVDLRTNAEIKESGTIPNSKHIDFKGSNFSTEVSQLPKNEKYILYCRSGGRSSNALSTFNEAGLEAYNMLGGYTKWIKSQKN